MTHDHWKATNPDDEWLRASNGELHEREAAEKQHGDKKHKKEQYLGRLSV